MFQTSACQNHINFWHYRQLGKYPKAHARVQLRNALADPDARRMSAEASRRNSTATMQTQRYSSRRTVPIAT